MRGVAFICALLLAAPCHAAGEGDADRIAHEYVAAAIKLKAATGTEKKNQEQFFQSTAACTRRLFKENSYTGADVALMSEFIAYGDKGAKAAAPDFMKRFEKNGKVITFFRSLEECRT